MFWLVVLLIAVAVLVLPGWWVKRILGKYATPEDRYETSGRQMAHRLLKEAGLRDVVVERTEQGDHYDPRDKAVRLSPMVFDSCSLTAVTVAAHEVGHAIQDATGYRPLRMRTGMAVGARWLSKGASVVFIVGPLLAIAARNPMVFGLTLAIGVGSIVVSTLLHLVTLPVELDASFGRALPLLRKGGHLHAVDIPHAHRILKAAAFTYVAQALISLATAWRWMRIR